MRLRFFQSDFGTLQELGTVAMVVECIKVVRGGPLEEKILASQSVSQMTSLMEQTTEMGRLLPFWFSIKLSNNANHYLTKRALTVRMAPKLSSRAKTLDVVLPSLASMGPLAWPQLRGYSL